MRKEIYRIFATMAVISLFASALWADGKKPHFEVISTIPTNGARGVPTDQMLTVTFNEKVECSTVTTSTFTLKEDWVGGGSEGWVPPRNHGAVAGIVSCLGTQATFTLERDLEPNITYTATIKDGVEDVNGHRLEFCFSWCFRTGSTATPPTVTAVTPLNKATGVALNTAIITATFDQAMNGGSIDSSTFLLTGPGLTTVTATSITYDALTNTATFVLPGKLTASTLYTATITNSVTNLQGNAMVSNFVWTFTTGATPDIIPPTVISTIPLSGATGVPLNQIITATFSKAMAPATITTPPQFTLKVTSSGTTVLGVVTFAVVGNTATFTPSVLLKASTQYTATIETGVTDVAGNHLVSNYVWKFTTGTATVTTAPTVVSTNPVSSGTVCISGAINATFSEPMDFATFNSGTFYVTGPASALVLGTLSINVTGTIVTFTPTSNLTAGTAYTATITTGVTDLLGNPLASNHVWSFTASGTCVATVPLGTAAPFGVLSGTGGMTNTGVLTVINGDIGTTATAYTSITGFHDLTVLPYVAPTSGCTYTETGANVGLVTGVIYTATGHPTSGNCPLEGTAATALIATTALGDASTAYTTLAGLPGGPSESGQLGGKTLFAGTYTSSTGFLITGGDLTLDAQGNANAVWVFQTGASGTLTVGIAGYPRTVHLINGAQASNVFWHVGSAATINYTGGGTMVGTIIAYSTVTLSSPANSTSSNLTYLTGRAISLTGSVTMVQTVITVP